MSVGHSSKISRRRCWSAKSRVLKTARDWRLVSRLGRRDVVFVEALAGRVVRRKVLGDGRRRLEVILVCVAWSCLLLRRGIGGARGIKGREVWRFGSVRSVVSGHGWWRWAGGVVPARQLQFEKIKRQEIKNKIKIADGSVVPAEVYRLMKL